MNSQYGPVLPETHKEPAKYMVGYILIKLMGTFWKNSERLFKKYPLGNLVGSFETNSGLLFKKYPLGTLVDTFQKNSPHTRWVMTGRIASKLTTNSQCTHWVSVPSPPVNIIGDGLTPIYLTTVSRQYNWWQSCTNPADDDLVSYSLAMVSCQPIRWRSRVVQIDDGLASVLMAMVSRLIYWQWSHANHIGGCLTPTLLLTTVLRHTYWQWSHANLPDDGLTSYTLMAVSHRYCWRRSRAKHIDDSLVGLINSLL